MKTIKPPPLKPGDKIGIVSPARFIDPGEIEGALNWIRARGYEPVLGKHVFDRYNQFAGTDIDRANDIISFINNPDIACIWVRLTPRNIPSGLSDTVILLFFIPGC